MTHPGPELTDYVDGTLPASAAGRVQDHLRTCATCRREVDLATAARFTARAAAEPTPPPGLADAAIAEAAGIAAARSPEVRSLDPSASQRPRPASPRWLAILGAAAVIALIALLVPKLGQPGARPPRRRPARPRRPRIRTRRRWKCNTRTMDRTCSRG